jgi:thiol:disulfide interchange protein DsbD
MKNILLVLLFSLISIPSIAQDFSPFGNQQSGDIKDPVDWEVKINTTDATNFEFVLNAYIDDEWHIYSQTTPNEGIGPIPLAIQYLNAEGNFEKTSELIESKTYREYSETWGFDEVFFKEKATLTQKINLLNPAINVIKAELTYQVCKTVCLNEERYIVFDLAANKALFIDNYDDFEAYATEGSTLQSDTDTKKNIDNSEVEKDQKKSKSRGLWTIFFIAFLSGFAALLTPCVFPMIPLTVSFFTKQSKDRAKGIKNAILYAIFIVVIYVVLGSVVTAIFGADALNALSTNVWFNIIFFVLLVVFAISFLGAFEITLPQSWANAVDKNADRGGIAGIFFMALALAIVSFSCTGPIVGTLLVEAASSGGIAPIIGMLGFSLAIALPFALFALFPGLLNSLPKSGGWLNTVKVFLGFLELALAFKFLSKADLVTQSHLLEREVFLAIWIAIFGALALYLFGKIKLPHDGDNSRISVGRLLMGVLVLTFTIYLIPGIWGAPLKIISGFPPPMSYSESPYGVGFMKGGGEALLDLPENAKYGPHDIVSFTNYYEGLAYAKKVNKPILVDFTGFGCENCRKMEERIWAEPKILRILKNDIVLISLYVDEKKELPSEEHYTSATTGKRVRTYGNKWSDFQIERYQANAQPYYILMNLDESNLNAPVGYTPDVDEYEAWLKEGISNFSEKK